MSTSFKRSYLNIWFLATSRIVVIFRLQSFFNRPHSYTLFITKSGDHHSLNFVIPLPFSSPPLLSSQTPSRGLSRKTSRAQQSPLSIMASRSFPSFGSNDSGYDSGITEVFDCETSTQRYDRQDYVRDMARQRQHMLAGELSRMDASEYQQDILDHMMSMDVRSTPF